MNRRQKMKRMKQELEWYKKQMVPVRKVNYIPYDIITLGAEQMISQEELNFLDRIDILEILNRKITAGIDEYIEYIGPIYDNPECYGGALFKARLNVAIKHKDVYFGCPGDRVPHGGDRI